MNIVYMKEPSKLSQTFNPFESVFMARFVGTIDETALLLNAYYVYPDYQENMVLSKLLELEPCEYGIHVPKYYEEIMPHENISLFKCIKPGQNVTLFYNTTTKVNTYLFFEISLCIFEEYCKHLNEIELYIKDLRQIGFNFVVSSSGVDHYNYSYPIYKKILSSEYYLSPSLEYQYYHFWDNLVYDSDNGIIFEKVKSYNSTIFNFEKTRQMVVERDNAGQPLGVFSFSIDSLSCEKYVRNFEKLQSVIASIGSILSVLKTLGKLIVGLFTGSLLQTTLVDNVLQDKYIYNPEIEQDNFQTYNNYQNKKVISSYLVKIASKENNNNLNKKEIPLSKDAQNNLKQSSHTQDSGKHKPYQQFNNNNQCYQKSEKEDLQFASLPDNDIVEVNPTNRINQSKNSNIFPKLSYKKKLNQPELSIKNDNDVELKKKRKMFKKINFTNDKANEIHQSFSKDVSICDVLCLDICYKKRTLGRKLIEASEKIVKKSLSCEGIIRACISTDKLISLLTEEHKKKFYNMKPKEYKMISTIKKMFKPFVLKSIQETEKKFKDEDLTQGRFVN